MHLYRAIGSNRDTVEFWFSERRNLTTAKQVLRKAFKWHGRPGRVMIDGSQTNRSPFCPATWETGFRIGRDAN
jgi:putative transposase